MLLKFINIQVHDWTSKNIDNDDAECLPQSCGVCKMSIMSMQCWFHYWTLIIKTRKRIWQENMKNKTTTTKLFLDLFNLNHINHSTFFHSKGTAMDQINQNNCDKPWDSCSLILLRDKFQSWIRLFAGKGNQGIKLLKT